MKTLIAVALVATSAPVFAESLEKASASRERRHCTQVSVRAGSRLSGRRICRTAAEWREALGADWRQHLAGARSVEEEVQELEVRSQRTEGSPNTPW